MDRLVNLLHGTVLYAFGNISTRILALVSNIALAVVLGPKIYGFLAFGWGLFTIVSKFSELGVPEGVTRNLSIDINEKQQVNRVIQAGYLLIMPASIGVSLLSLFLLLNYEWIYPNQEMLIILLLFAAIIPLNGATQVANAILRGYQNPVLKISADFIGRAIGLITFAVLVVISTKRIAGIGYYSFFLLANAIMATYFARKYLTLQRLSDLRSTVVDLFVFSWPLTFQRGFLLMMTYLDILVIGYLLSAEFTGIYRAAWVIAQIPLFGLQVAQFMYTPVQSRILSEGNLEQLQTIYRTTTKFIGFLTIPVIAVVALFPDHILTLLYGGTYVEGSVPLTLLVLTSFVRVFVGPDDLTISTLGQTRLLFITSILGAATNLTLNVSLVPRYGIVGAAVATLTSFTVLHLVQVGYLWHTKAIAPFQKSFLLAILLIAIAALGLREVLKFLPPIVTLLLFGVTTSVATVVIAYSIGMDKSDKVILRRVLNKSIDRQ